MRFRRASVTALVAGVVTTALISVATAQSPGSAPGPAKPPAGASRAKATVGGPAVAAYAAMPGAERLALQSDLATVTAFEGVVDGVASEALVAAVKTWQTRNGLPETGALAAEDRTRLAEAARLRRERIGWTTIDDRATGIRFGLPANILTERARSRPGGNRSRWTSVHGEVVVETFRVAPGLASLAGSDGPVPPSDAASLARAIDRMEREPRARRVEHTAMGADSIVVAGLQGLKRFQLRAQLREGELRGLVVLYDQALEVTMDAVAGAMAGAFVPFPDSVPGEPPFRARVEYATAVVVSRTGDLVSDAAAVADCATLKLAGAQRLDKRGEAHGVAVLRLVGAGNLPAVPLAAGASAPGDVTILGIADPKAQAGGAAVSAVALRAEAANEGDRPTPPAGFAGAAVIDRSGRLAGLLVSRRDGSVIVPADTLATVLARHGVTLGAPAVVVAGRSGLDAARAAVMRVICVRD